MNREHLDTERAHRFNGSRDGIWDVVELQIEPNLYASGQNGAHNFGPFGCVKLQPDFEKRDLALKLLNQAECLFLCGDIKRHDDFVSDFCHGRRRRDISVLRPRARDSSTSLGMTEQIAGNASHGSSEDQSFAESSRSPQRWFS